MITTVDSDAERYLLRAVLEDARLHHFGLMDACPVCRAAGGCCEAHWDRHQVPVDAYGTLGLYLEGFDGRAGPCPLGAAQWALITSAAGEAVAYRTGPLAAAYRELATQLTRAREA